MNRNKRGLALNLATERGKALFLRLVRAVDVIVENNSARVMPNLGLGWERLQQENPRLVMASISGFGATGPQRDWVAFGSNIEAACGLAAITGYDDSTPYRTGSFIPDPIAGGHAVVGILAALERRDRTGIGAHLDIALTESAIPFMTESITYYQEHGALMPRMANADPAFAPTGAYRCAGTDDWVALAVRTPEQWLALCAVIGMDAGAYPTNAERVAVRAKLDALVSAWTRERAQYDCARRLQAAGVPAAPILKNWQLHCDPHLYARGAFLPIEHPDTGVLPYPGFPWRFSATQPRVRCAAPRFAEGNAYVFRTLLQLGDTDVEALYRDGVTADAPEGMRTPIVA
jgi:crotonobetainyl-CoA:carnitine CoA-transferase CaiB-like acyl-CoA transferase